MTIASISDFEFETNKPFYPLILNYCLLMVGMKEVFARGLFGPRDIAQALVDQHLLADTQAEGEEQWRQAHQAAEELSCFNGPEELVCRSQDACIQIDVDALAAEYMPRAGYLLSTFSEAAGSLLLMAHEVCKDEPCHDNGPLWEFLRHCRNAVGHRRFNFLNGEPRRPAEWRNLKIEPALQGTRLFGTKDRSGLLSPGDPIALLWDIEQAYPNIPRIDPTN
ncbi:MAG: hypothetical protein M3Y56_02020 [Armatimonadota bacterium]|nr:hypothetical protein [Armatimonadota bacterium]